MKKIILIGTAALIGALTFAGCGKTTPTIYDTLNELANQQYTSVALNVSTTLNGITLTGEYISTATDTGYQIRYTYEQLATFEEENSEIVIPDSYKATYSGTAEISNGAVISQSGNELNLQIGQLTVSALNFSAGNFSDVHEREGSFTAKVTNINGFFGQSVKTSNMTAEVEYSASQLVALTIRYDSNGATVVLSYTFQL